MAGSLGAFDRVINQKQLRMEAHVLLTAWRLVQAERDSKTNLRPQSQTAACPGAGEQGWEQNETHREAKCVQVRSLSLLAWGGDSCLHPIQATEKAGVE